MKSSDIRQTFLDFFAERGHAIIPSAPVVPEHDPTTLFNIAGMQPLTPYLLGQPHPAGKRLANVQKCIRTIDIDEVGDDSHATFMEMLGFWSLGDYFKEKAILYSWEFFTKGLGFDSSRMAVTVFAGDESAPRDEESVAIWRKTGVPKGRIFYRGKDDNWWGPAGQTGPCGPSTEIFYWVGEGAPKSAPNKDDRWLEICNNVLMQYEKTADGKFKPLVQRNIDTGLGLERVVAVAQGKSSVYETDLMIPIMEKIRTLTKKTDVRAERIVADHLKAATFIIADGVRPSNVEQGYVLRRLIRRAIRQGRILAIEYPFTETIAEVVVDTFGEAYPELKREQETIRQVLLDEEAKFSKTIDKGIRELTSRIDKGEQIGGTAAFWLFETYGFPIELTLEELRHHGQRPDARKFGKDFEAAFQKHQQQSRKGAEQKFAGGLADHSGRTVRMHTATHLLLAALRDILGDHVHQRGSNINAERLRFDFSHPEKLTPEQLTQVEALVNEKIREDLPVTKEKVSKAEADRLGARGEFGHKYGERVTVYSVGDFSKEICGGPHVEHTAQIGMFKILKQESSSAGVRRVKATIGDG